MKTDRELLELAAKAAGINLEDHQPVLARDGKSYLPPVLGRWNPLDNRADAMELAAKLTIDLSHNHPADQQRYVAAERRGCEGVFSPVCAIEDEFDEKYRSEAMCRAIVRAAAAIQEAMEAP